MDGVRALAFLALACVGLSSCTRDPQAQKEFEETQSIVGQVVCSLDGRAFTLSEGGPDTRTHGFVRRIASADPLCSCLLAVLPPERLYCGPGCGNQNTAEGDHGKE